MKTSRTKTFLIGLTAGVAYAFFAMWIVSVSERYISIGYIFILPSVLGIIPVMLATKEQLRAYRAFILLPWSIVLTFFFLSFIAGFEGLICLVIIVGPFLILGSIAMYLSRLATLKRENRRTPLYPFLALPFLFVSAESFFKADNDFYRVETSAIVNTSLDHAWHNIKNVRNIRPSEISTHFVHLIGVPKPLSGELDREGVGGNRRIIWEKGIRFNEKIKTWDEGKGFTYDILVDPSSIPPSTLDEHVMIGGKYFDVLEGGYQLRKITKSKTEIRLWCKYRITSTLNFYGKLWADFILDDFNEMILEVIKQRCEKETNRITVKH